LTNGIPAKARDGDHSDEIHAAAFYFTDYHFRPSSTELPTDKWGEDRID
jgi:hypothetical protein